METKLAQRTFYIRARSAELNDRAFDAELLPQFFHLFHRQSLSSLDRVVFDLRRVNWGNPYGALGIVLMGEVLRDYSPWALELWLAHPNQQRKRNTWLAHIGLPQAVDGRAEVVGHLHEDADQPNRCRVLPITALPPSKDQQVRVLKDIALKTHEVLVQDFHYDAVQAGRFITALSELCTNIYDHSTPGGQVRGYVAMQAYQDTVKFAVMDLGIGIPKSLRSRFEGLDDGGLIQKAFEPGVSARHAEGRGLGLTRVCEIVERQHGILNIRAGRAKVLVLGRPRQREVHTLKHPSPFPGTKIGIFLRRVGPE